MNIGRLSALVMALLLLITGQDAGAVFVQCPGDTDGDAVIDTPDPAHPNAVCMHLSSGDGFAKMADGTVLYTFGFADLTGVPPDMAMEAGMLAANFPAPTIAYDEGQELYLTLTNVGMVRRPDLFDAHTVHFHGYANASSTFDGEPMASFGINMGSSLTYYYNLNAPGTYVYHCHVEASEHMQMGMLGNLYVRPKQDKLPEGTDLNGFTHHTGYKYAYNDGDGSTYYDKDFAIQIAAFDPLFHKASVEVETLPFANMKDTYPMLNGRGYPDTVRAQPLFPPSENGGKVSQPINSKIVALKGEKVLLRLSSLSTVEYYTLTVLGIPMKVVGKGARLLRGPSGTNLYYNTSSVNLGGGETVDVILDTTTVRKGRYFLYTTNLSHLSNNKEDFGGAMTEIVIQ